MFSTFCFSSDFTSNIYKLETEEILNRFVCEIFKMEFEINSTKKTLEIYQCSVLLKNVVYKTEHNDLEKKFNYSNMSLMIAKQFQGNMEIFS